uniref:Zinc finger protein ZAT9 n=1 Tax=Noccaea caerulescens TaxID=107243 RepID=A0A1J3CBY2_NOCCA
MEEKGKEKQFVCRFCNKNFPSGKSLGGHIRIHTTEYSVSYNRKGLKKHPKKKKKKKKKRLVDEREIKALKQQQQHCCRECGKGFISLKGLCAHMDCHSEGKKMLRDIQSDTETSSPPSRERSKRVMRESDSVSLSSGSSSSVSEIDQDDNAALTLIMLYRHSKGHNLVASSVAESSENNSVILETKSSPSGEKLVKMFSDVKIQELESDKVAVDQQLRSADDDNGALLCDSDSSDSDYFMNGPKKSDSDISVDQSLNNTGVVGSGFRNTDELRVKEGGSKYELSKRKRVLTSYESDSCAETSSKIHRSSDTKSPMAKKGVGAKKKREGHECPICFRVFKSGQALGGHKRSHSFAPNQEHRIEQQHQLAEMHHHDQFDLNLPATDFDE